MPVTPFHLGPALLLKSCGRSRFSLGVFALVQIAIDVESLWNLTTGNMPIHAHLHTLYGALAVSVVCVVPGKYMVSWLKNRLHRAAAGRAENRPGWLLRELGQVSWTAAGSGALLGGVTHVLLDAMMHPDVTPFAPWWSHNPLVILDSFDWLHGLCVLVGIVGLALWLASARRAGRVTK